MRILKVLFFLAALPIMAAAQSAQGQAQRRDPCTLPEGGVRRGAPADATARAQSSGQGQKSGLNQDRSVNCTPTAPPPPPPGDELPPPTSETAEIQGTAFGDVDVSFTRSAGETGLAGWTITLSGPVSGSTVTDADGNYSFIGLTPGTYVICEDPQIGWWQSAPMDDVGCASGMGGYTRVVSPDAPGVIFRGNDFGNVLIGF
jgi:hypothetical protein